MATPKTNKEIVEKVFKKDILPELKEQLKEPVFNLTITLGGVQHKGKGATALEALKSIKPPVKIFTKGDIELTCGKKSMKQTWQPFKVKRLFFPIAQTILSKQLEYLMK